MKKLLFLGLFFTGSTTAGDHPHLVKTVTTDLPGAVEVSARYQTAPAGEVDPESSPTNRFLNAWAASLQVAEDLRSGVTDIPAGRYTVGLIKKGSHDWTLALHPGRLGQKEAALTPRLILPDTLFSRSRGSSEHLVMDFDLGSGRFEGEVVLTFHLGDLYFEMPLEVRR